MYVVLLDHNLPLYFLLRVGFNVCGLVWCNDGQWVLMGRWSRGIFNISTFVHVYNTLWYSVRLKNTKTKSQYQCLQYVNNRHRCACIKFWISEIYYSFWSLLVFLYHAWIQLLTLMYVCCNILKMLFPFMLKNNEIGNCIS